MKFAISSIGKPFHEVILSNVVDLVKSVDDDEDLGKLGYDRMKNWENILLSGCGPCVSLELNIDRM